MFFGTVYDYVKATENCSKFAKILNEAGTTNSEKWVGSKTLFVPNDASFEKLTDKELLEIEENPDKLITSLLYTGDLCTAGMFHINHFVTVNKTSWSIELSSDNRLILGNKAHLVETDIVCSDGVVHVIDTVLLP